MSAALKFKSTSVPRQKEERARLKVVFGPDQGSVFVMMGLRARVGRGEDNDVVLSDLKSSRHHAEVFLGQSGWEVRDLGSANGILWNNRPCREAKLKNKDTLTIGETVLEFVGAEQGTILLVEPPRSLEQIRSEQDALEAQREKVRQLAIPGGAPSGAKGPKPQLSGEKASGSKARSLLLLGALALGYLFLQEDTPQKSPSKPGSGAAKGGGADGSSLAQYLPQSDVDPAPVARSAEIFFQAGFREYNQGNYLRAKTQFETVLQMSPGHELAGIYLRNSENRIKDEVKFHLDSGRKGFDSGKLRAARGHFESALRLLYRDPNDPAFVEAKEQLEKVRKELKSPLRTEEGRMD